MIRPLYPIPVTARPPRPPARRLEVDVNIPPPTRDPDSLTVGELLSPLRRRWLLVALLTVLGLGAGLVLALRQKPVYESTALIEVAGISQEPLSTNTTAPVASDRAVESNLQTQVRILQSPELLRRVAEKLDLWHRPEFHAYYLPRGIGQSRRSTRWAVA